MKIFVKIILTIILGGWIFGAVLSLKDKMVTFRAWIVIIMIHVFAIFGIWGAL